MERTKTIAWLRVAQNAVITYNLVNSGYLLIVGKVDFAIYSMLLAVFMMIVKNNAR